MVQQGRYTSTTLLRHTMGLQGQQHLSGPPGLQDSCFCSVLCLGLPFTSGLPRAGAWEAPPGTPGCAAAG